MGLYIGLLFLVTGLCYVFCLGEVGGGFDRLYEADPEEGCEHVPHSYSFGWSFTCGVHADANGFALSAQINKLSTTGDQPVDVTSTLTCGDISETIEMTLNPGAPTTKWFPDASRIGVDCQIEVTGSQGSTIDFFIINTELVDTAKYRNDTHAADEELSKVNSKSKSHMFLFASRIYNFVTDLYPIIYIRTPGIVSHHCNLDKNVFLFKGALPPYLTKDSYNMKDGYYGRIPLRNYSRALSPYFINQIDPVFPIPSTTSQINYDDYTDIFGVLIYEEEMEFDEKTGQSHLAGECEDVKAVVLPYSKADVSQYRTIRPNMYNKMNEESGMGSIEGTVDQFFQYGGEAMISENYLTGNSAIINCYIPCDAGQEGPNGCDSPFRVLIQGSTRADVMLVEYGGSGGMVYGYNTPDSAITGEARRLLCYNTKFMLSDILSTGDDCIRNDDEETDAESYSKSGVTFVHFFGIQKFSVVDTYTSDINFFSYIVGYVEKSSEFLSSSFVPEHSLGEFVVYSTPRTDISIETIGGVVEELGDFKRGLMITDKTEYHDPTIIPTYSFRVCNAQTLANEYHVPCDITHDNQSQAGFVLIDADDLTSVNIYHEGYDGLPIVEGKSRALYAMYVNYRVFSKDYVTAEVRPRLGTITLYKRSIPTDTLGALGFEITYGKKYGNVCVSLIDFVGLTQYVGRKGGENGDVLTHCVEFKDPSEEGGDEELTKKILFSELSVAFPKNINEMKYAIYSKYDSFSNQQLPLFCVTLIGPSGETVGPHAEDRKLSISLTGKDDVLVAKIKFERPVVYNPYLGDREEEAQSQSEIEFSIFQFDDKIKLFDTACNLVSNKHLFRQIDGCDCDCGSSRCTCTCKLPYGFNHIAVIATDTITGTNLLYEDGIYKEPPLTETLIIVISVICVVIVAAVVVTVFIILRRKRLTKKAAQMLAENNQPTLNTDQNPVGDETDTFTTTSD